MHRLLEQLLPQAPIITDGAWGTELQNRGLSQGEFPDSWNLRHPEKVAAVAESYVAAGSRIILTNTFGSNAIRLAHHELKAEVRSLNKVGVEISKRAAGSKALVFASIGPSGKLLLMGETTEPELETSFAEQAEALAEAQPDGLVVETMSDLAEASLAVRAAKRTGLPVVACVVFEAGKNKDRTMMGKSPSEAVDALLNAGADVIGANCGQEISHYLPICRQFRACGAHPIWLKPNAGMPKLVEGKIVYGISPDEFANAARELVAAGAQFIGGCCGTNPSFIRELHRALD